MPSTMNVSLPDELARFVRERVDSGLYSSASEVVREALRLLATSGNGPTETSFGSAKEPERVRVAIRRFREGRQGVLLGEDLSLRDLVDEGRP